MCISKEIFLVVSLKYIAAKLHFNYFIFFSCFRPFVLS
jgi:hypothetical protein